MMSAGASEAEDLAQEALLRSVRSLGSFDSGRGSIESWLWRIVANTAKDAATRRRRIIDTVARLRLFAPRESASVEEIALQRIGDTELHKELRRLPLRDQTLIALRFGADLDMRQVGAAVGLSSDSAARALSRALARLRARLQEVQR
jgi:RNA polymerase sigma factor (sigma-70 family)